MGDVNYGYPFAFERSDYCKELLHIVLRKSCGGFIEDKQAGFSGERFCDFNHLLLPDSEIRCNCTGANGRSEHLQELSGFLVHCYKIDKPVDSRLVTQKNVLSNSQVVCKRELLVYYLNRSCIAVADRMKPGLFTVNQHTPRVKTAGPYSCYNLYQSRFTCSIFSNQSMNLSLFKVYRYIVQCPYTGKLDCDILQRKKRHDSCISFDCNFMLIMPAFCGHEQLI